MALFKKATEEVIKIEKQFVKKDVLSSFIKAIVELGDFEDYKAVSKKSAEIFFRDNEGVFRSLTTISADNLNILVDLLNCFFSNYNLGSMDMNIDEEKGEVIINHSNSPFIHAVKEHKSCAFLVEFYKNLFEFVLNEKVNVEEIECGVDNEKCIFKVTG